MFIKACPPEKDLGHPVLRRTSWQVPAWPFSSADRAWGAFSIGEHSGERWLRMVYDYNKWLIIVVNSG